MRGALNPFVGFLLLVLPSCTAMATPQQDAEKAPSATVESVDRPDVVRLKVTLHNSTGKPLILPYCGYDDGMALRLCFGGVGLQRLAGSGWDWAPATTQCGVIVGAISPSMTTRLEPHTEKTVVVYLDDFSLFHLKPGARARLVVQTWPDDGSINTKEGRADTSRRTELASQPFDVPPGSGAEKQVGCQ